MGSLWGLVAVAAAAPVLRPGQPIKISVPLTKLPLDAQAIPSALVFQPEVWMNIFTL